VFARATKDFFLQQRWNLPVKLLHRYVGHSEVLVGLGARVKVSPSQEFFFLSGIGFWSNTRFLFNIFFLVLM
jgi:hypothetical protein